ncbi:hypothetical protein [Gordonia alkaliphila]|uniref:Uncharacterized protein n=1 Tax=Gordonia alkaliphila TaxID=1053547 RepID=A0ABP8ZH06_9ACTN
MYDDYDDARQAHYDNEAADVDRTPTPAELAQSAADDLVRGRFQKDAGAA